VKDQESLSGVSAKLPPSQSARMSIDVAADQPVSVLRSLEAAGIKPATAVRVAMLGTIQSRLASAVFNSYFNQQKLSTISKK
jgi:hypothetical protein